MFSLFSTGMSIDTPTCLTFILYIIAMVVIGWCGYRATSNLSDYILGGRQLGSFVTALSAGASDMSGWLLMGLPGAVFLFGLSQSWIAIGLIIGAWLNWIFVAGRLRIFTEKFGNSLTLSDYLSNRFDDKSNLLRIITALVILVFFTIYCGSGIVAGARLFENMFGLPYQTALWVGALATISYVFVGGFLAVSWTDTVQASLMITALILVPIMVIHAVGGIGPSVTDMKTLNPSLFSMWKGLDGIAVVSLLAWGLGYCGQPHILVRFMAAKSAKQIPTATRICMTWMILCLGGAVAVGLFGIPYFYHHPDLAANVTANNELVFIELVKCLFNHWFIGFLLAAILAAIMSTLSCQLLVSSSALTEDIYRKFLRKEASQKELVWFGRGMVLLVSVIAFWIASYPNSRVLQMVSNAWAGFGAAFGPIILVSLLWPRMTRNGALIGMIVGAATVLIWKHYEWLKLYEIIPGFVFNLITIFIVSLLDKAPSKQVSNLFAEARAEFKK